MQRSHREGSEAEGRSFQEYYSKLYDTIRNPARLAAKLFSAKLLSSDIRDKIQQKGLHSDQVTELLSAVEAAIIVKPDYFHIFLSELELCDGTLKCICDDMRSECGECDWHC